MDSEIIKPSRSVRLYFHSFDGNMVDVVHFLNLVAGPTWSIDVICLQGVNKYVLMELEERLPAIKYQMKYAFESYHYRHGERVNSYLLTILRPGLTFGKTGQVQLSDEGTMDTYSRFELREQILSRFSDRRQHVQDLNAQWVDIIAGGRRFRIFNVRLPNVAIERRRAYMDRVYRATNLRDDTITLTNFNIWVQRAGNKLSDFSQFTLSPLLPKFKTRHNPVIVTLDWEAAAVLGPESLVA